MKKIKSVTWLVPVTRHRDGKVICQTVQVFAPVSEWDAQKVAGSKIFAPRYDSLGRENRHKGKRSPEKIVAGHAISKATMACLHGCCSLRAA